MTRLRSSCLGAAFIALTTAACLAQNTDVPPPAMVNPDAGEQIVDGPMPGPDLEVSVRTLLDVQAQRAFVLAGEALIVATSTQTLFVPGPSADPVDFSDTLTGVTAVSTLLQNRLLIAAENGLFVLDSNGGRELSRSPISDTLTGSTAQSMLTTPNANGGVDIWMGNDAGLFLWTEGQTFTVQGDAPTTSARLTFGAPIGSAPAVWLAAGQQVSGLVDPGTGLAIYPDLETTSPIDGLAVDGEGTLWMVSGGVLRSRSFDGRWFEHSFVEGAVAVAALPSSRDLWVQGNTGLWHHEGGVFRKVSNAPTGDLLTVGPSGFALLSTADGLTRVETGRTIAFRLTNGAGDVLPSTDGQLVGEPITVTLMPESPDNVVDLTATLDGLSIDVLPFPSRVNINPEVLEDGFHSLVVRATYRDGGPDGAGRLGFFVGAAATWVAGIQPLSKERCEVCHNPRGNAHTIVTMEEWIDEIDPILRAVREGRMPLLPNPPLEPEAIQLIQQWKDDGFPP